MHPASQGLPVPPRGAEQMDQVLPGKPPPSSLGVVSSSENRGQNTPDSMATATQDSVPVTSALHGQGPRWTLFTKVFREEASAPDRCAEYLTVDGGECRQPPRSAGTQADGSLEPLQGDLHLFPYPWPDRRSTNANAHS